ncbi:MAG TPA: winged helix-turn-helix domain-containing protein [Solirubrobacterales bacterium]|nr:winged helix-turn-helix domain-containing protein [Solirubrobacterales bacterium]
MTEKTPRLIVPELTKALKHPTRTFALAILTERVASPKEIAEELGRTIRHVTYHLGVLEDLNCVELVRTESAGGGRVVEHFYKATKRPWLDRESWAQLDTEGQQGITSTVMEMVSADIEEAISAGTFSDPADNHLSRTPMSVDKEGWAEVVAWLAATLDGLIDIQGRISNRSVPETELTPIKVEILHFRSPGQGKRY